MRPRPDRGDRCGRVRRRARDRRPRRRPRGRRRRRLLRTGWQQPHRHPGRGAPWVRAGHPDPGARPVRGAAVAAFAARAEAMLGSGVRPVLRAHHSARAPLSLAQQRMWFLNRFDRESAAYNIPIALRMTGALDIDALRAAVKDVVVRHEVLRTVYPEDADGPMQVIVPAGDAVPVVEVVAVAEADLMDAVLAFSATVFDVMVEVPLQARVFPTSDTEFVLAVVMHHIAGDGSSLTPLARDLMVAYTARLVGEAPNWAAAAGPVLRLRDLAARTARFRGRSGIVGEPTDRVLEADAWRVFPTSSICHSTGPGRRCRPSPARACRSRSTPNCIARSTALARAHNATLFMAVHAALAVLLARLSALDDIAIGTPYAGRGDARTRRPRRHVRQHAGAADARRSVGILRGPAGASARRRSQPPSPMPTCRSSVSSRC